MPDLFTIPGAPAELLARINERRAQMAPGMTMMADPPAPPADPVVDQDEPLGPAGVKALQQERDARGELEKQLKAMQDQFTGVAEAFGVKVEKGAKPDEALMRLPPQWAPSKTSCPWSAWRVSTRSPTRRILPPCWPCLTVEPARSWLHVLPRPVMHRTTNSGPDCRSRTGRKARKAPTQSSRTQSRDSPG